MISIGSPLSGTWPHWIDEIPLSRESLGDAEFEREFKARCHWLDKHLTKMWEATAIRECEVIVGRRFWFRTLNDAMLFRLTF
jgi:hypothetical protein